MIELSDEARKELESYFEGKEKEPIRIYMAPGGCCGPRLTLALDAPAETDLTEEKGGFSFCINKELADQTGGVKIDMTYMGFSVEPTIPFPETGGGCSGCTSCGSH